MKCMTAVPAGAIGGVRARTGGEPLSCRLSCCFLTGQHGSAYCQRDRILNAARLLRGGGLIRGIGGTGARGGSLDGVRIGATA